MAGVPHRQVSRGIREKLLGLVPRREGEGTCVWIHAVSVGEVNLMATTIAQLRAAHPDWQIVVSTTSRTGFELARKKYADLTVFYCPLDFSWAVRTAMRRVRPTLLVLAELELWPNLILAAKGQGARVAIINGRMSDHSFPGYRRIRPLVAGLLTRIDLIAAQNEESAERFRALGAPADRVHVTGSLKYDGAQTDRNNPRTAALRQLAEHCGRRHRLSRRQHAGAGRADGGRYLSPLVAASIRGCDLSSCRGIPSGLRPWRKLLDDSRSRGNVALS